MLDDGYFTIQLLWLESLSSEVVLGFLFVQQLIVETQTLLERKLFIIMLINVPSLNLLTPSFARCIVDVRVLSIWKFDTSDESSEQFGLNMKLLHEKETSIEAYINLRIVHKFQPLLYQESEIQRIDGNDRSIPRYAFDFVLFKHIHHMKQDNNILIDIVGIIGFVEPPSVVINEQGHEEKFVEFGITDGIQIFQVILWDNICVCTFTNHPATRFAINSDITIVQHLSNKLFALGQSKSDNLYSTCSIAELKMLRKNNFRYRILAHCFDISGELFICIGHTAVHNIVGKSVFEMLQIQNFLNDVPLVIMNIVDTEMMVELTIGTCDTHKGLLKYDASQIQLLDQVEKPVELRGKFIDISDSND
ncbi:hypothetical protein DCAR_0934548 [Daucus carota subsp. sativus]|uniref:Uncharacterized protein n=1 Tax=Daucus carota subsp. sativus TaxID=79200 RepID=A0A175YK35_DAUCS|nr:hypothetical protein DCAR_0934548 [Daucus carota subsp. sativus]